MANTVIKTHTNVPAGSAISSPLGAKLAPVGKYSNNRARFLRDDAPLPGLFGYNEITRWNESIAADIESVPGWNRLNSSSMGTDPKLGGVCVLHPATSSNVTRYTPGVDVFDGDHWMVEMLCRLQGNFSGSLGAGMQVYEGTESEFHRVGCHINGVGVPPNTQHKTWAELGIDPDDEYFRLKMRNEQGVGITLYVNDTPVFVNEPNDLGNTSNHLFEMGGIYAVDQPQLLVKEVIVWGDSEIVPG